MGDRLQAGQPCLYVASHRGQLSLAIPPWVGAMSISESWDGNRHTARCTSPISMVWQCKLVPGWGLMKRRSAPLYQPYRSGRTLHLRFLCNDKYWLSIKASLHCGIERAHISLFHELNDPPISYHSEWSVITAHNFTPVNLDDWNISGLFIKCMSHAEHTVNYSHEISMFHQAVDFIMPYYTRTLHSRPWWNVYLLHGT